MNYIDKLLQGQEVEWRTLGDVVLATSNIRWRDTNKSYRYIDLTSVSREQNIILETTEITKDNAPSRAQKLVLKDDVIFATTRPTQQRLCLITDEYSNEVASTGYCVLRANTSVILPKWIFYWIASNEFKIFVEENQSGSAYPAISDAKVKEFQIPIPFPNDPQKSLAIQQEIVRVLDSLSEQNKALTTALAEEIENRKKQYAYYREELFRFEGKEVEWKTLGEVATYSKKRCNISQLNEYNYVGVDNLLQNRSGKTESKHLPFDGNFTAFKFEDILIGNIRPYLKKIWFATCDGGASGDVLVIQNLNDQLSSKYLYQILADDRFFNYNMSFAKGAKMPRGDKKKIMDYKFPIPFPSDKEKSIQEQERIVRLLDQYDTASKNIIAELEKEIELRNKQYEYYRNQLLMFNG